MAVVASVESAIRIHIDRGDDLNARDDKGQTPLMLAAARNKASICKLLLEAGADADLLDPVGRSALNIAQAAGATEAARVIEAACMLQTLQDDVFSEPAVISPDAHRAQAANDSLTNRQATDGPAAEQPVAVLEPAPAPATLPVIDLDLGSDGAEFDLAGWVAEEELAPPEGDPSLSAIAIEIQSAISEHEPIDTSADWEGFEALLPERATPLPRADDAETRERLRLVLLRAIREGSIPAALIDVRKSTARPPVSLRPWLTLLAENTRERARRVFAYRGTPAPAKGNIPIEQAWRVDRLKAGVRYRIEESHPSVAAVLEKAGELAPLVRSMLRVIEETVPVQRIWLDTAENKETPRTGFDGEPNAAVIEVATVLFQDLIERKGLSVEEARKSMSRTEPFQKYPALIEKLGSKK